MPIIELPNGDELEYPEGMSMDAIRKSIFKKFPQFNNPERPNTFPMGQVSQDVANERWAGIKNLGVGAAKSLHALHQNPENQAMKNAAQQMGGIEGVPQPGRVPNFEHMARLEPGQENQGLQSLPGMAAGMYSPNPLGKFGIGKTGFLNALKRSGVKGLGEGQSQYSLASSFNPESQQESGQNAGIMGMAGSIGLDALRAVPGLRYLGGIVKNPMSYAKSAEHALNTPEATKFSSALKRQGIGGVSPGQIAKNENLIAAENEVINRNAKNSQRAFTSEKTRAQEIDKANKRLMSSISPSIKATNEEMELYNSAKNKKVSDKVLSSLTKKKTVPNPKINENLTLLDSRGQPIKNPDYKEIASFRMKSKTGQKAVNMVLKDATAMDRLKGIKKSDLYKSGKFWDEVNKKISHMERVEINSKAPDTNKIATLTNTRNKINEQIYKDIPELKEARRLAEPRLARKELEKKFNSKDMNAPSMHIALKNKEYFKKLLHSVRGNAVAEQNLKDMRMIVKNLPQEQAQKLANKTGEQSLDRILTNPTSSWQVFSEYLRKGKYDDKVMDVVTSPNMSKELHKITTISDPKKQTIAFMKALNRANAQKVGQDSNKQDEE